MIVSADDHFMIAGEYQFDAKKLSEAHASCFHKFISALHDLTDIIVVDNTNTTAVEIAPYVLGAQAYNCDPEIVTVVCLNDADLKLCVARNRHGVDEKTIRAQHKRVRERKLPPWWENRVIPMTNAVHRNKEFEHYRSLSMERHGLK